MEEYNYLEAVKADVLEYLNNEVDFDEFADRDALEEYLYDVLFVDDSVTGNGSGSYTFNSFEARQYVICNLPLLIEISEDYGSLKDTMLHIKDENWEYCDVVIRCGVLHQSISDVLDEYFKTVS
jgi:hypothetical protein